MASRSSVSEGGEGCGIATDLPDTEIARSPEPRGVPPSRARRLPRACLLAVGVLVASYAIELFILPITCSTFRAWEALSVRRMTFALPGPFYPNMEIAMVETGDLGHHTPWAVPKAVEWRTDRYGYRASPSAQDAYPVVIIGDSSIAGSTLTQEEMLSSVLARDLGQPVYAFAPATMNDFLSSERFRARSPRVTVLGVAERGIVSLPPLASRSPLKERIKRVLRRHLAPVAVIMDRLYKNALFHALRASIERAQGRLAGIPSRDEPRGYTRVGAVLFYQGADALKAVPEADVERALGVIAGYAEALRARGIRLIVLPVPGKETIYHDVFVGMKRPDFLDRLRAGLQQRGVEVVDTQGVFEADRQQSGALLYHTDDSHWNAHGVAVAAAALGRLIEASDELSDKRPATSDRGRAKGQALK